MIAAALLFQLAFTPPAPAEAPERPAVSAQPLDLSAVASRVHVKRAALEGWVPRKGAPAPPSQFEPYFVPESPPPRLAPAPREEEAVRFEDETVNAFDAPRPWFFAPDASPGGARFHRRHLGRAPHVRAGSPGSVHAGGRRMKRR